jgi:hypothetical protein
MAEQFISKPETAEPLLPTKEHAEVMLPTAEQATPLQPGETVQNLEQARATVETTLESTQTEVNPLAQLEAADQAAQPVTPREVNQELRQITLRRELQEVRHHLSAPQRVLSRLIHQPAVRAVSEVAGQTVSRPSGLLGGGLLAFFGTSGYLYLAKHDRFSYNYLVFLVLLVGGFALGLILECVIYLATRSRRQSH